ncbi:MAG: right-handed parallel beta-helix repeat-containing protein [Candidatus Dormibacteraeota bacterium]|nr:right-handed parallel beta-helix repeat-containing protein [Candidatus Dormibacteraeota bacterium]
MRTRSLRAAGAIAAIPLFGLLGAPRVQATTPKVLLVCPTGPNDGPGLAGPVLSCPAGQYASIQDAVNHAGAGDWILVAPGDYHEKADTTAGVHITTPNIHLRGMDRNGVVVDGTKATSTQECSSAAGDQDTNSGHGRNGIEVFKVDGTSVDNITACNYLNGDAGAGNEIWWNGGDGSGVMGMNAYSGSYITGTTTYSVPANNGAYGVFVSNARGPGLISYAYASNMSDSGFYVGACSDCNATLDHVHSENNVLGYSGTNAGGHLDIKNSEWDLNKSGIVPNSLNNDDAPPPQTGLCPMSATKSCTYITNNSVHDNNNPNTPGQGIAAAAPIGTGIELSGASWNIVDSNTVYNQKGWGIVTHDFPDTETPPASGLSHCQGGISAPGLCTFPSQGNVISNNTLHDNGGFGNPSNGDLANESSASNPRNCFHGNTDTGIAGGQPTSDPPMIQTVDGPPCSAPGGGDSTVLLAELVCASGIAGQCPAGVNYPQSTGVQLLKMSAQTTMPNPCAGVPDNPWCTGGQLTQPATFIPEVPLLLLLPLGAVAVLLVRRRSPRSATAA